MIFLLFILNVFSGVTDSCTSVNCTMAISYNGVNQGIITGESSVIKTKAANEKDNLTVIISDATVDELDKKTKKDRIDIDLKGILESGSNLNSSELRELLLYLLEK